ncbi:DNA gyrase/topoisomerase IV subunit A [uncultured Mesonia sp.]|uniref:DNA gyrase/topoisomerase IV subunit A n=1 Tax=uncultured Mesonia sp. TaxID=399731 RepID=UPI00374EE501
MSEKESPENNFETNNNQEITRVTGMYKDWFLDYASYVILERAVPALEDGFKPVHRRIMQSMKDLDDGRYNKVANIVGHTMQYHPHGDASIADALVQIGQKDLLIDTQGNWGNILTGDRAAAPRYIEARLSKFALEVIYNPKITNWQASYDGRRKEPIALPVMFPLLLAQGAEGIAVGLSTRILPHNFNELIDASIQHLRGKRFKLYPDFPTAGIMDVSNYNDGLRGGKVRIRAKINQLDKHTLVINEIPYGTTTGTLIESIIKANEKGKIKVKHIEDNTAEQVEILIHLPNSISPDKTIDALYAFTNCEISISPLSCIIIDHKPHFLGVSEILRLSTNHTLELLKKDLEIKLDEHEEQWHFASLERIFIEKRIYRDIENQDTWEGVLQAIDDGLKPHIQHLKRAVTREDLIRLTEIKIKRISKFDLDKAQQKIEALEDEIAKIKHNLANLIDYAVDYFNRLKKNFGKDKERKTELRLFEDIEATKVVIRNTKLYVNRKEGFIGTSLKKDEYVGDCSDIDDIICFTQDGIMKVTRVDSKTFIGKNIIHVAVFKKKDKRTIYNLIYRNGTGGNAYVKRFAVTSITRDKEYSVGKGKPGTKILYFSANPNGEAEKVAIYLRQIGALKKLRFELDFADQLIKGRTAKGNLVSKHPIKKVELKEEGVSTLKPRKIWFDETIKRLNVEERGELLGEFKGEDRILLVTQKGVVSTIKPELITRFDDNYVVLEKWNPEIPLTAVYWEGEKERYYVKRFFIENEEKEELIITDHPKSQLELISTDLIPVLEIKYRKQRGKEQRPNDTVNLEEFIAVKGIKAQGNQLTTEKVTQLQLIEPIVPSSKADPSLEDDLQEEELDIGTLEKQTKAQKEKQASLFDEEENSKE